MRTMMMAVLLALGGCAAGTGARLGTGDWRVTDINGVPPIAGSNLTLRIEDKRVSGHSGCNSFSGGVELMSRERIRFTALTQTRMACADPAMMEQENRLTSILQAVEGYGVYGDGSVSLIAGDGRAVRLRRSG
jgi:heat shock protein HslJ